MNRSKKKRDVFTKAIIHTIKDNRGKTLSKREFLNYANQQIKDFKGLNQYFSNITQLSHYLKPFTSIISTNDSYEIIDICNRSYEHKPK